MELVIFLKSTNSQNTNSAQVSSSNSAKIGFYAGIVPPIYIAGQGKLQNDKGTRTRTVISGASSGNSLTDSLPTGNPVSESINGGLGV